MQFLYDCSIQLAQLGVRLAAIFKPKTKRWLRAQQDLLPQIVAESKQLHRPIWVHCASLGEFEQGRPLIEKLREQHPGQDIVLTFFSPSGYDIRKDYDKVDRVFYLPMDSRANVAGFLQAIKPRLAVFVKYEIWPNYLAALQSAEIPSFLISAKFTEQSQYFKPGRGFLKEALKRFDHIFVQDTLSETLLQKANYSKVSRAGDTRIDRVIERASAAESNELVEAFCADTPALVAGSTWWSDEQMLKQVLDERIDVKLILAPHEIDAVHLSKVEDLFSGSLIRYSELLAGKPQGDARVLLIDNIGLLASLYRYGNWAYVGGGFESGIHNVLEAAVFELPVFFGPNHSRFKEAIDLKQLKAAFAISAANDVLAGMRNTEVASERKRIEELLKNYFQKEKGATNKIYAFLKSYL